MAINACVMGLQQREQTVLNMQSMELINVFPTSISVILQMNKLLPFRIKKQKYVMVVRDIIFMILEDVPHV